MKTFDIPVRYSRNSRQYLGPINLDFLFSNSLKEFFDDDLDLWTASTFPIFDYIIPQADLCAPGSFVRHYCRYPSLPRTPKISWLAPPSKNLDDDRDRPIGPRWCNRILHASHPRTGTAWSIYPSYDFAHGQSDAIERVTHSLCTLEFEDHRPLYDWFLEHLPVPSRPRQYEFARLNLTHTVLSKRVLTELVRGGHVKGWDDPRMPTLAGLRRRGVPPQAVRDFVKRVGVAKANSVVDIAMFDFSVREVLNKTALRRMAVLRPLKVVIENYPEAQSEELEAVNHPDDPAAGTRRLRFGRELYIERDDFMENPPKKFYRLSPGREVRLRYAYFITCREVVKNRAGEVVELRCSYDPQTRGGNAPDGRKVQATLHWVSDADAVPAEVRLYNQLFARPDPNPADFIADLNPDSLEVLTGCKLEPELAAANTDDPVQFERQGYFCRDPDSTPGDLVFNRTVGLRDTWARVSGGKGA